MARQLVIGDIHGSSTALALLDEELRFGPDDLLITLGDYVDRGPDSRGVIDALLSLRSRCHLVTLRGNHEIMILEARTNPAVLKDWLAFGGAQTLDSYGARSLDEVPQNHWQFLEQTERFYETERDFFVHANALPDVALAQQPDFPLFWERFIDVAPHQSGKRMICGHTAQKSGLPQNLGHALCIDTWVYGPTGWLTCLDAGTGHYWQANQKGQLRDGEIL